MRRWLLASLLALLATGAAQELTGRHLIVGTNATYPPFATFDQSGEIVGFDVDLVAALCERLGCTFEFVSTAWDGVVPGLEAGDFDLVAAALTITEERRQVLDFSEPYFEVSQAIVVRVEDEDLTLEEFTAAGSRLRLGAQTGTTNAAAAEGLVGRERVRLYDDFNASVQGLLHGDVDGVMIDDVTADAFVEQYAGQLAVGVRGVQTGEQLGLAVRPGNELLDSLNAGIEQLRADGTLDELAARWFGR